MMHVVLASDLAYLPWLAVPISSIIEQLPDSQEISFHLILSDDCKETSLLNLLISRLATNCASFYTYYLDKSRCGDLPISGHGSIANYYRLFIPSLLPSEVSKAIYLDCDLLVIDTIQALWEVELGNAAIGAVSDMALFETEAIRLGIPYLNGTFNSGVLLLNLDILRKMSLEEKCLELAKQLGDKIRYWDQDLLNIALQDSWLRLDHGWNIQHSYMLDKLVKLKYPVVKPRILHFSGGGLKPWQTLRLPGAEAYMERFASLALTPNRRGFVRQLLCHPRISLQRPIKKAIRSLLNHTLLNRSVVTRMPRFYSAFSYQCSSILAPLKAQADELKHRNACMQLSHRFFPTLCVQAGPFRGMQYPFLLSKGSTILPKLAGSYELELAEMFSPDFISNFSDFYDIGCAEGYYAVGIAMLSSSIRVQAYDTDTEALDLCRQMAALNGVAERISLGSFFDLNELAERHKSTQDNLLLLVDCEGAEAVIFSSLASTDSHALASATVIVEAHEFLCHGVTDHLIRFFSSSHSLHRILSVGDLLRPTRFRYLLPSDCDHDAAYSILSEQRPAPMEWLIFSPLP